MCQAWSNWTSSQSRSLLVLHLRLGQFPRLAGAHALIAAAAFIWPRRSRHIAWDRGCIGHGGRLGNRHAHRFRHMGLNRHFARLGHWLRRGLGQLLGELGSLDLRLGHMRLGRHFGLA